MCVYDLETCERNDPSPPPSRPPIHNAPLLLLRRLRRPRLAARREVRDAFLAKGQRAVVGGVDAAAGRVTQFHGMPRDPNLDDRGVACESDVSPARVARVDEDGAACMRVWFFLEVSR